MEFKILKNIEEEKEKARDDAEKALDYWRDSDKKDTKELLYRIYGVDKYNPPTSFVNTGNVKEIAFLSSRVIVTIFPFGKEEDFQRCYKTTPKEMLRFGE